MKLLGVVSPPLRTSEGAQRTPETQGPHPGLRHTLPRGGPSVSSPSWKLHPMALVSGSSEARQIWRVPRRVTNHSEDRRPCGGAAPGPGPRSELGKSCFLLRSLVWIPAQLHPVPWMFSLPCLFGMFSKCSLLVL